MLSTNEIAPGLYRHYKGNLYEVIGVASHSETEESLVVYRALYGARGMWVRPFEMFMSDVEVDGQRIRRFAPIDGEPGSSGAGSSGHGSPDSRSADSRSADHGSMER